MKIKAPKILQLLYLYLYLIYSISRTIIIYLYNRKIRRRKKPLNFGPALSLPDSFVLVGF